MRHFTSPPKFFLGKAIGTEFLMMSNVRIFSFISVISIRVIHGVGINIFDDKFAKIAMCLPAIFNIRICNWLDEKIWIMMSISPLFALNSQIGIEKWNENNLTIWTWFFPDHGNVIVLGLLIFFFKSNKLCPEWKK